jgi:hypothetical protein
MSPPGAPTASNRSYPFMLDLQEISAHTQPLVGRAGAVGPRDDLDHMDIYSHVLPGMQESAAELVATMVDAA